MSKNIKVASSIWLKESKLFPEFEGWQNGYGAFTYSIREKDILIENVKNQKVRHRRESSYEEYERLLKKNEVEFDERYLLSFECNPGPTDRRNVTSSWRSSDMRQLLASIELSAEFVDCQCRSFSTACRCICHTIATTNGRGTDNDSSGSAILPARSL